MKLTTSMEKQILLPPAVKREMLNTFKASRSELGRALTYKRNSSRAKVLRAAALQRGGLIYTSCRAPQGFCPPDVETRHDHVQGMMYQTFGDRVELQISLDTGNARLILDNEYKATFANLTIESWGNVLYSLQQIYNRLNS